VQEAKLKPLTFTRASGLLAASPAKRHPDYRSKATDSETFNITPTNNFSQLKQFLCLQKIIKTGMKLPYINIAML
jgi:hypothetical protein